MKHLLIVPVLGLALTACQTMKPPVDPAPSPTDQKIAELSTRLAKQCNTVAVAIALGAAFNTNPKLDKAITTAEAARKAFCAAPPSDINTAIATLADMAQAIADASRSVSVE